MAALKHVGVIPDGTRRWALREGVDLADGYDRALATLSTEVELCFEYGATAVSLYLVSTYNLRRAQSDLGPFVDAGERFLRDTIPAVCNRASANAVVAGRPEILPERLGTALVKCARAKDGAERTIYLCAGYDPHSELNSALSRWQAAGMRGSLTDWMWVPEKLDLVIRTGGARTLSDFLPLQSGYAQITFRDELFNDFPIEQFRLHLDAHRLLQTKKGE